MFDMMKMMGKVKEVQEKMKAAQENLAQINVEGESGAGLIKAVVNGKKQLVSINIDPSLLNAQDKEMLQDLVVAAINMATEKADEMAREELRKSTDGILPNMPGFDFGNMV